VHGKNHPRAGSFGHHVLAFELLRSDGGRRLCRPGDAEGWFRAAVGGLGLTGVITWAELQLRRVPGAWIAGESHRFDRLADYFALVAQAQDRHEYAVAWIDCLARGDRLGRGVLHLGDHAAAQPGETAPPPRRGPGLPFTPPLSLVNGLSLRAFNTAIYHRQRGGIAQRRQHYDGYFYPLDGVRDWNRMYGPRGFLQYQCVLPPDRAADAVAALLREISASGQGSFLAVLKPFGARPPAGMLSFPRPGTTLALDFPNTGPKLMALLERLDAVTAEAGGAVYPAKDARWPGARFRAAYPDWQAFLPYVDPRFSSGFWRRAME
jgi:FAD/FMN-containing dehydrogenase